MGWKDSGGVGEGGIVRGSGYEVKGGDNGGKG